MRTHSSTARTIPVPRRWRGTIPPLCLLLLLAGAPGPAVAQPALNVCDWTGVWVFTGGLSAPRRGATATQLNDGRVLIVGGFDGTNTIGAAEVYDPATSAFATVGSLVTDRTAHTATLLADGRVLIAGGIRVLNGTFVARLPSAELFDPATGNFSPVANMGTDRQDAAAVRLSSGRVLIAGGFGRMPGSANSAWLPTAELYDPATGGFTPTGSMAAGRGLHQMTRLSNDRVLVSGGFNGISTLASAELFDPAAGTFAPTGAMTTARLYHAATLLPGDTVLLSGGSNANGFLASTESFNPATNSFSTSATMGTARRGHTVTRLPIGRLVVAGGENASGTLASAEISFPGGSSYVALPPMPAARAWHTASLLPNGNIVLVGGMSGNASLNTAVLYDTLFTGTGAMTRARSEHTATRLDSGQVLIVGGQSTDAGLPPLASAELYTPGSGTFAATGSMSTPRHLHTATLLVGGRVLITGGMSAFISGTLATAELFDPFTGTFSAAGSMATARYGHTATRLANGRVLIAGGAIAGTPTASAEIYDPNTNTFAPTGTMNHDRLFHTATLLHDGRVLITGGQSNTAGGITFSTEFFDPSTGTFSQPPNVHWLWTNRSQHAATLLADGRVLITGGYTSGLTPTRKAEVFNPFNGFFAQVGDMSTPRARHAETTTALPGGRVLVAGGNSASATLDSVETFDPATGTFTTLGSMNLDRYRFTATLLLDTRILVAGGAGSAGGTAAAELSKPTNCGPMITLLTPSSGPVGTAVTISGSQFGGTQGASSVTFNGTLAGVGSWSDTQISTSVPINVTTGPVIVTVNGRNSNAVTFTVTRPDLVETAISDPPSTIQAGYGFAVTDSISNIGSAVAGSSTTRYYLSLDARFDSSDILLNGSRAVGTLPPGSKPLTDTVKVGVPASTPPGTYYLLGCVDDLLQVAEVDERNNCRASRRPINVKN